MADFDASIRISDLGGEPSLRSIIKPDLSDTLRKVNGPQGGLERTLINEQRKKSATLQSSFAAGSPRRRPPPRVPLTKSFGDIDSSPLTSTENLAAARRRLSTMISREKELMTDVKCEKPIGLVSKPQHVSKLADRLTELESNEAEAQRQQQSQFRRRAPLRHNANNNVSSSVRRKPPTVGLAAEFDNSSDELSSGESLFLSSSKFTASLLQTVQDEEGVTDEIGRFAQEVYDLGIIAVQLWKVDAEHASGAGTGASLYSTRYDGMQVYLGAGRTFDMLSMCKSCGDVSPVFLPGSQPWVTAESMMQLLMPQPPYPKFNDSEKSHIEELTPKKNWERILAIAIPSQTTACAGVLMAAESKLSKKPEFFIQSLQRIAIVVSWKWNVFAENRQSVAMNHVVKTCTSRMEVAEALSSKVMLELSNPVDVASTAKTVSMLGQSVLKFKHAWCLLESPYQDRSVHGVDSNKWVSIFYGRDKQSERSQNPKAVLISPRHHLLRQMFSSHATVMRVSTMKLSPEDLLEAGMLDESDASSYECLSDDMNRETTDSHDIAVLVISLIARPSTEGIDSASFCEGNRCILCLALSETDDIVLRQSQAMMLASLATQAFSRACAATKLRMYAQLDTIPDVLLGAVDITTSTARTHGGRQNDSVYPYGNSSFFLGKLLSMIQSNSVAHRLMSATCSILVCGSLYQETLNELDKVQYGASERSFYYLSNLVKQTDEHVPLLPICGSGVSSTNHLTLSHLGQFGWMKALQAGKPIIIQSMMTLVGHNQKSHTWHKAHTDAEHHGISIMDDVEHSFRDDAEINLYSGDAQMPDSCAALCAIIRSVNEDASSAAILPIFTAFGMCMLVLTHKLSGGDMLPVTIACHANGYYSTGGSEPICERKMQISCSNAIPGLVSVEKEDILRRFLPDDVNIINSSGVLKHIATILNTCVALQSSGNAYVESKHLKGHVSTLSKIIENRHHKTLTAKCFKYWYAGALLTNNCLRQSEHIKSSAAVTYEESRMLVEKVSSLTMELVAERRTKENSNHQLDSTRQLLQFCQKTTDVASISALSNMITDSLPSLLCCDSVVLLLAAETSTEIMFQKCHSEEARRNNNATTAPLISLQQIKEMALYVDAIDDRSTRESVILLYCPPQELFGVLFVVHSDRIIADNNTHESSCSWKGDESLLTDSLASCIYSCISRVTMAKSLAATKESLSDLDVLEQKSNQLTSQLSAMTLRCNELEASQNLMTIKYDKLVAVHENAMLQHQADMHTMQCEQEGILEKKDDAIEVHKESIELLQQGNGALQRKIDMDSKFHSEMLDIIEDFSRESCGDEDVIDWLVKVVGKLQLKVFFISLNSDGTLNTEKENVWGLKGVIPIAAEALRNNGPVQVETFYTDNKNSTDSTIPKRGIQLAAAAESCASEKVFLRCLPNVLANTDTLHSEKYACFVYVKPFSSGDFSLGELQLLQCVTSLTCSWLMKRNSSIYDADEIRQMEVERTTLIHFSDQVKKAVKLMESVWRVGCKSKEELGKVLEGSVSKLLKPDGDALFTVDCQAWYPPSTPLSNPGEFEENMCYVMKQRRGSRKGCVMWHPLTSLQGEVVCVLQIEKRFGCVEAVSGRSEYNSSKLSVADLYITKEEGEVVDMFCRLCMPILDNVKAVHDAYSSIQQASQAMVALQQSKGVLEDSLAKEASQRSQVEDALKAGAEILGAANSQRVDSCQLLDMARHACMSVTAADECFVIFPKLPDAVIPVQMLFVGHDTSPVIPSFDPTSLTKDVDAGSMHYVGTQNDEYAGVDGGDVMYTLEADRPSPLVVRLETGDIEYIALQHGQAVAVPAANDDNDGMAMNSNHNLINLSIPWHSWCVRRMQSGFHSRVMTPTNTLGDEKYCVLAVPFAMVDGRTGVICLFRKASPFIAVDRECTKWIGKVMSFCLHLKKVGVVSIGSGKELQLRVDVMEKEVAQLTHDMGGSMNRRQAGQSSELHAVSPAGVAEALAYQSFGDGVTVSCWDTKNEQCEAKFDFSMFSKSHGQHSSGKDSIQKVNSVNGEILYTIVETHVGSDDTVQSLVNYRERKLMSDNGNRRKQLFAILECSFGSKVWLKLEFLVEDRGLIHLRLIILLKLFETEMKLTLEMASASTDHCRCVEMLEDKIVAMNVRSAEDIAFHKEQTANTKDKYKSVLSGKSKSLKSVQSITVACWRFNIAQRRIPTLLHKWPNRYLFSPFSQEQQSSRVNKSVLDLQLLYVHAIESQCSAVSAVFNDSLGFDVSVTGLLPRCGTLVTICSSAGDSAKGNDHSDFWRHCFERPISFTNSAHTVVSPLSFNTYGKNVPLIFSATSIDGKTIHAELLANKIIVIMNSPKLRNRTNLMGEEKQDGESISGLSHYFCYKETYSTLKETLPLHAFVESSTYPDGTLLIPIHLQPLSCSLNTSMGAVLVLCIAPSESSQEDVAGTIGGHCKRSKKCRVVHYTELHCLDMFRRNFLLSLGDHFKHYQLKLNQIKHCLLKGLDNLRNVGGKKNYVDVSAAFERLKANVTETKLRHTISCSPSPQQLRHLEQVLSNWTELVKGAAKSVSGISSGVAGLWASSCGSFMSLISTHISLKGCGLLIANQDGEVVELTVRELSSPSGDRDAYGNGVIDVRPATDLGHQVRQLAWDLLNDSATGGEEHQKVWKLSKVLDQSNSKEQLWLSPIRTGHNVMAVLRVSVEPFAEQLSKSVTHSSFEESNASSASGIWANKSDQLAEYRDQVALQCFTNFADIFALLVSSAGIIDEEKSKIVDLDHAIRDAGVKQEVSTLELTTTIKKLAVLTSALSVCFKAAHCREGEREHAYIIEDSARLGHGVSSSAAISMAQHVASVAQALSRRLSGVMLGARVKIELSDTYELDRADIKPLMSTNACCSQYLVNESQAVFGSIIVYFDGYDRMSWSGDMQDRYELAAHSEDITLQSPLFDSPTCMSGPSGAIASGDIGTETDADVHSDRSIIASILPALSESVSVFLCGERRTIESALESSLSSQSIKLLEQEVSSAVQTVKELRLYQDSTSSSIILYKTVADIANQCLRRTYLLESRSFLDASVRNMSDVIFHLLSYVGNKIASLLVKSGQEHAGTSSDRAVSVRFGLVPNDTFQWENSSQSNLTWFSSSDDANGIFDSSLKSNDELENFLEIAANLAENCINKRASSSVDMGSPSGDQDSCMPNTTRVTCFPLIYESDAPVIGALQILVAVSSSSTDHGSHKQFDDLCTDIAQSVANTLFILRRKFMLLAEKDSVEKDVLLLRENESAIVSAASFERASAAVWKTALACVSEIFSACGRLLQTNGTTNLKQKATSEQHAQSTRSTALEDAGNVLNNMQYRTSADLFQDAIVMAENSISALLQNSPISLTLSIVRTRDGTKEETEKLVLPLRATSITRCSNVVAAARVSIDMLSDSDALAVGDRHIDIQYWSDVAENGAMGAEVVNYLHNNIITIMNIIKDRNKIVDNMWSLRLESSDVVSRLEIDRDELQKQLAVCEDSKETATHVNKLLARQCAYATVSVPTRISDAILKPTLTESKYFLKSVLDKPGRETVEIESLWSIMCGCLHRTIEHIYSGQATFHVSVVSFDVISERISVYDHGIGLNTKGRGPGSATSEHSKEVGDGEAYYHMKFNSATRASSSKSAVWQCFRSGEVIEQVEYMSDEFARIERVDMMGVSDNCLLDISIPQSNRSTAKDGSGSMQGRSVTLLCIPFSIETAHSRSTVTSEVKTAVRILLPTVVPPSAAELHDQMMGLMRSDGANVSAELFDNEELPTSIISKSVQMFTSYVTSMASRILELRVAEPVSDVAGRHQPALPVNGKEDQWSQPVVVTASDVQLQAKKNVDAHTNESGRENRSHRPIDKAHGHYDKSSTCKDRDGDCSAINTGSTYPTKKDKKRESEVVLRSLEDMTRCRRQSRVVCREMCGLLDPPMVGIAGATSPGAHPASLSPLLASQDACLKTLNILRTLVRGEGQAILMRDATAELVSYQVIYTGDALGWSGIEQGCFGTVSSSEGTSLVEAAISSHKSVHVPNAAADHRYCSEVDGNCNGNLGCPYLVVPLRGRGGCVAGAVVVTRGSGGLEYSDDDIRTVEMVSAFAAISLYWCQGIGSLHHLLIKRTNRVKQLENVLKSQSNSGAFE